MAIVGLGLALSGCVGSMVCEYVPSVPMTPIAFPPPPVVRGPVLVEEPGIQAPVVESLPAPPERAIRRSTRQSKRAPGARTPGQFRLAPETPEPGTPEATREERQYDQRERDLNRQIRGICRGC
jgi:hypothetical protein